MLKFCVENFQKLEKSMSYAFSISIGELNGQNECMEDRNRAHILEQTQYVTYFTVINRKTVPTHHIQNIIYSVDITIQAV
jgi:hypothetical protein